MQKEQRAVFFDWDGTAVRSRNVPPYDAVNVMKPLLAAGIKLVIVSGTTYDKIAGGQIQRYFTAQELDHLYLGLGRGAYNYAFREGIPYVFADRLPDEETLLDIHTACFEIHKKLLSRYGFPTDIIFTRPNYCKIDLMVENDRGDQLFMQENELERLKESLARHGIRGLRELLDLSVETGEQFGLKVAPTCDAKYLEVGMSSKSDNVDEILDMLHKAYGITPEECSFWGDEFIGIESEIYGSDSFMITERTKGGGFFDVSDLKGDRPKEVKVLGGGVQRFLGYLRELA